jgi:integration host factor subunit beta
MAYELRNSGRVEIRVLCALKVKEYPGYTGRNQRSGEPVTVKPKKLPFFKCGADLKKRVGR